MKWIKEFREWIAAGVTLVAFMLSEDLRSGLRHAYAWFDESLREAIVSTLVNIGWIVWSLCAVWSLIFLTRNTLRWMVSVAREIPYLWMKMKGMLGMAGTISKDEAMKVIVMSDFFRSRQPQAKRNKGLFDPLNSFSAAIIGESERDAMLRRRFLRMTIAAFEDQRPEAVTQDGYDKQALTEWLDALLDREVEQEMGIIPRV